MTRLADPIMDDDALEAEIALAADRFRFARSPAASRVAWRELQALIKRRSPEQIAWMEEQRGLAR